MDYIDYHMHSSFSSDSEADMEDMIKSAIAKGVKHIALTDHVDFFYPDPDMPFMIDYDIYSRTVSGFKEKYKNDIDISLGVEIGLQRPADREVNEFLAQNKFDFVIGSTHCVNGLEMYGDYFYKGKAKEEAYREYFEDVLKSVRNCPGFNIYGHLDYVNRYGGYTDKSLNYDDYRDIIDEIFKELISRGKGIEINSSGFRYGLGHAHPQLEMVKTYKRLGGEIITTGSDAHKPEDVAADFEAVYKMLGEAGFKYVTVFKDGSPEFVKY